MRKKIIIKITTIAILMAMSTILKYFSITTGTYRISLFDTPLIIAGIIAGPLWGALAGFGSDLIYSLFSGYQYSFIMAISAILWGVAGGIFYKRKVNIYWLFGVMLLTSFITTAVNSVQLYVWYQGGMWVGLPGRVITMFIKWPVTTMVVYVLNKKVVEHFFPVYHKKPSLVKMTLQRKPRKIIHSI